MVLSQADYDGQRAETLLLGQASVYSVRAKSRSAGNSPINGRPEFPGTHRGNTPTSAPPLPGTAPVGVAVPSPPIYSSPHYRPDTDLSLPPRDPVAQVQLVCEQPPRSTSLNVVVQNSQLSITIAGAHSPVVPAGRLSPWGGASPLTLSAGSTGSVTSLTEVETKRIQEQCQRRECLRSALDKDRRQLDALRKTIDQLQEELTKEKMLLANLPQRPAAVNRISFSPVENENESNT